MCESVHAPTDCRPVALHFDTITSPSSDRSLDSLRLQIHSSWYGRCATREVSVNMWHVPRRIARYMLVSMKEHAGAVRARVELAGVRFGDESVLEEPQEEGS